MDSLRLFTAARYSSLPGHAFPGAGDSYPGKDDVAAYLADYATHFDLDVHHHTAVQQLRLSDDGFVLRTSRGTVHAHRVIAATGPFHDQLSRPWPPCWPPTSNSCTPPTTAHRHSCGDRG